MFQVHPLFSALPGVSAHPFGGSARTIVNRANPERLISYGISLDELAGTLAAGNTVSPSGNLLVGNLYRVVPTNALVKNIRDPVTNPARTTPRPPAYLRDVATVDNAADLEKP